MILNPLPESKIPNLSRIFASMLSEANLERRTDVTKCIETLKNGFKTRTMDAYVDNPEDPKHVLILGKYPGIATAEKLVIVNFIYSVPEERGNPDAEKAFFRTIENYAAIFGADAILASSWCYKGSRRIDAFWVKNGFEKQEIVYVKLKGEGGFHVEPHS